MPRGGFIVMVLGVVLVGAGVGWWLGRPEPLQPVLHAHPMPAGSPDPSAVPTGSDTSPGWQNRQALRKAVATALDQLESSPCDPTARKAFFQAYADMEDLHVTDSGNSPDENGPAFWRTDDDMALGGRVVALMKANYITQDEIARVMFQRRLGAAADQGMVTRAPMQADKCGSTAASVG